MKKLFKILFFALIIWAFSGQPAAVCASTPPVVLEADYFITNSPGTALQFFPVNGDWPMVDYFAGEGFDVEIMWLHPSTNSLVMCSAPNDILAAGRCDVMKFKDLNVQKTDRWRYHAPMNWEVLNYDKVKAALKEASGK